MKSKRNRRSRQVSACILAAALLFTAAFGQAAMAEGDPVQTEPTTSVEPTSEPTTEPPLSPTPTPTLSPTPTPEPTLSPTPEPEPVLSPTPTSELLVTPSEAPASDDTLTQETQTTEGETEKVTCTCKTACTADTVNTDCPVCSADSSQCTGTMPEANTVLLGNEPDTTLIDVQDLIDALPTAEELKAMPSEEQQAVYTQLCEAYDAYEALSDEQKAQVTGAEIFDALFAVFNEKTEPLEDRIITGGTYSNSDFADMKSGETLKITGGVTQFTDSINLPSGVSLEITGGIVNVNGDIDADSIVIDGSAVVFCNSLLGTQETLGNCILFIMGTAIGVAYGQVSLPDGVTIPSGCMLWIGSSESVTIPDGVTLTNNGTINNTGTLTVKGDVNGTGTLEGNGTVNKKDQTAVNFTTERLERTDSRITILTESGQKYAVSVSNLPPDKDAAETWKDGTGTTVSFTGLNSNSPYWLYTYKPGNAYYNDSAVISIQFYTRELGPEAPTASEVTINYKDETISFDSDTLEVNTLEYFDGTYISDNGSIIDYIKDTENTIYVRAKQQGNISASAATPVTIPARPAAPADAEFTINLSVPDRIQVVMHGTTLESRIKTGTGDYGSWKTSSSIVILHNNIKTSDTYTIQVRKIATDSSFASVPVTKDNCKTVATYEITIPKTVDVGGEAANIEINEMDTIFALGTGGQVDVKVKSGLNSDGTLTLARVNDPSTTISSQMMVDGTEFKDLMQSVAVFKDYADPAVSLSFAAPKSTGKIPAGTYTGTVTFEISYSEP